MGWLKFMMSNLMNKLALLFMIVLNHVQRQAVNYYHKELYLGCCSSPGPPLMLQKSEIKIK